VVVGDWMFYLLLTVADFAGDRVNGGGRQSWYSP
jgi:hypothetical protein